MSEYTETSFVGTLPQRRRRAAEVKYAEAVKLYAESELAMCRVADICGVTARGLSAHIRKYHRDLLYARYGIDIRDGELRDIKVKRRKGQSWKSHIKYKDAVEACGDIAYIDYNVSQIAEMFNLNGSALASQLKVHFPGIIEARENVRKRLGVADHVQRGMREASRATYTGAMELYVNSDLTMEEVAEKCRVSKSGLCQFLRFYHQEALEKKSALRMQSKKRPGQRRQGAMSGNGNKYGPKPETVAKYAGALELYRATDMTVKEIVAAAGVSLSGFKNYLFQWHRADTLSRKGCEWDGKSDIDLKSVPTYRKSASKKYAAAIASLRKELRPVAVVAREFGLDADIFRLYLRKHEPALVASLGMVKAEGGKLVKRSSLEKYAEAIREYATTAEPLKSIAERHGLVYNSLCNYITRNCPSERDSHNRIVESETIKIKT